MTPTYIWEEMTFAQMMLAIEEMQSQVRAENGIKERIIGYVGKDWEPDLETIDMSEFAEAGFKETDFDSLPQDIRDIVLAENYRMKTNELMTVDQFKKMGGDLHS